MGGRIQGGGILEGNKMKCHLVSEKIWLKFDSRVKRANYHIIKLRITNTSKIYCSTHAPFRNEKIKNQQKYSWTSLLKPHYESRPILNEHWIKCSTLSWNVTKNGWRKVFHAILGSIFVLCFYPGIKFDTFRCQHTLLQHPLDGPLLVPGKPIKIPSPCLTHNAPPAYKKIAQNIQDITNSCGITVLRKSMMTGSEILHNQLHIKIEEGKNISPWLSNDWGSNKSKQAAHIEYDCRFIPSEIL